MSDWPRREPGDLNGPSAPRHGQPGRPGQPGGMRGQSYGQPYGRPQPPRGGQLPPRQLPLRQQPPRQQPPGYRPPPARDARFASGGPPHRPPVNGPLAAGGSGAGSGGQSARNRRRLLLSGRVVLAVVSVLVLGITGYSWATLQRANDGLTKQDVIDAGNKTNSGPQNILLVGIDTRTDAQGNPLPQDILDQLHAGSGSDGGDNTDTMIVIHIPAGGGKATAFSIPRDSYVQLAGGYGKHKINSAYTYGQVAATKQLRAQGESGAKLNVDAATAGAKNAIATVEQFTGLQINHFASVNLVGFYNISNAIGGVQVCLKAPVNDSYSGAHFPAGVQTVQGASALAYVRQRHGLPDGDLDRIKRQQSFMASMAHTVLSAGTLADPGKLNSLITAIQQSITLDSGWDMLGFAQQMESMTSGSIQFETIPIVSITLKTPSDGDAVEVDPGQVQSFIQAQINNQDAAPPAPASGQNPPPAQNNSGITTAVYNGTGTSGLAGQVLNALTSKGFTAGGTGNSATRSSTVVDYAPGDQASAQQVVAALGGNIGTAVSNSLAKGTVKVYLGKDYAGPKGASSSSSSSGSSSTSSGSSSSGGSSNPPAITAAGVTCVN